MYITVEAGWNPLKQILHKDKPIGRDEVPIWQQSIANYFSFLNFFFLNKIFFLNNSSPVET